MAGTMNWSDVYGEPSSPLQVPDVGSAGGPNQSYVNPAFTGPGTMPLTAQGPAPAFSILGMVLLLVALRVALDLGGDAD